MRTLDSDAPRIDIKNSKDLSAVLSTTLNDVLTGKIDPRVAYAVSGLANPLLKALAQSNLEERLERIERALRTSDRPLELLLTGD